MVLNSKGRYHDSTTVLRRRVRLGCKETGRMYHLRPLTVLLHSSLLHCEVPISSTSTKSENSSLILRYRRIITDRGNGRLTFSETPFRCFTIYGPRTLPVYTPVGVPCSRNLTVQSLFV